MSDLRRSIESYGFGALADAVVPTVLQAMQAEAESSFGLASLAEQSTDMGYRARIVALGPAAAEFLRGEDTLDMLHTVFDERFALTQDRSCLTFYADGDYLGRHRDRPAEDCAVTAIIYLAAASPAPGSPRSGLMLRIYGEAQQPEPQPRLSIPTRVGSVVVGRGSTFWHERPLLGKGEYVAAITGCYKHIDRAE
jgi:hypothetical protein